MAKLWASLLALWMSFFPSPLQKHIKAQSKITAYSITSISSGREKPTTTDVQMKNDRLFIRTPEFIAVDNTMYYFDTDGSIKNKIMDQNTIDQYNRFRPSWVTKNMQDSLNKSDFKKIGTEACGTLTCYKYEETDKSDPTAKRTFWFDNRKFLLRKDLFTYGEFSSANTYTYDNIDIKLPY